MMNTIELNKIDVQKLSAKDISEDTIFKQREQFEKGFIPIKLDRPALIGDGIIRLNEKQQLEYLKIAEKIGEETKVLKFVPASGAASRMFKELYSCLYSIKSAVKSQDYVLLDYPQVNELVSKIYDFAFFEQLQICILMNGMDLELLLEQHQYDTVIEFILGKRGLNYSVMPKALIDFHKYPNEVRKAAEEHLAEGALYARNANDDVYIHFTISPEHEIMFKELFQIVITKYQERYNVSYHINWSYQHESTDTVAVDLENQFLRDKDGMLVFRPGGHGALLKNLQDVDADIVFIKNIDNVTMDNLREPTIQYKKLLLGFLVEKKQLVHDYIKLLRKKRCSEEDIAQVTEFFRIHLQETMSDEFFQLDNLEKQAYLIRKLDRPIRVCGMVKNQGEPGGGPFFVRNNKGEVSLQIVESVQVDLLDEKQKAILGSSTHFNPVDIVASITDVDGKKFELQNFVDEDTYMITEKSKDGMIVKALELPGLWNGSMAGWMTFFIEVPIETFSPVKEINDLLRKEHCA